MGLSVNLYKILEVLSIILVLLSLTYCVKDTHGQQSLCGKLKTPGYTVPCGDIIVKQGDSFNITCNLYESTVQNGGPDMVKRLYFSRNNETSLDNEVEVINSTSIRLHVKNHPLTDNDNYYCSLRIPGQERSEFVCMNVVVVGVPPQEVEDFSCVSRNYENMTCTWTPPNNYCKTDYKLTYTLKKRSSRINVVRASGSKKPKQTKNLYNCEIFKENGKLGCFWNISSSPPYRQVYNIFSFTLYMNNSLGNRTLNYTFEHFKRLIPNPPVDLKLEATSPHSVHLSWKVPKELSEFPPGVFHRIFYYCTYEPDWKDGGFITNATKEKEMEYDITDLKYAHCKCTFRVSLLSAEADINDPTLWSANASKIIATKSKIPDSPPETTLGSFDIVEKSDNRIDIYVYWKPIEEYKKNGQDFRYFVELIGDNVTYVEERTSMFIFRNFENINYTVNIWSKNKEGLSIEHSSIIIPARRLPKPTNFNKEALGDTDYVLTWDPPEIDDPTIITNYTIFRCSNTQPYKCKENFEWVTVTNTSFNYTHTIDSTRVYQFAISANGYQGSSGMLWAECTISSDRTQGKLNNVWINVVGHDFIDVRWKLVCTDHIGVVRGFDIFYCPIVNASSKCNGANHTKTIEGGNSIDRGRITDLKPYTSYKLKVRVRINNGTYSQWSDEKVNTTTEAAPSSPPNNIQIDKVTNSSISLTWDPPLSMNGKLKFYRVYYNILGHEYRFKEIEQNNYTLQGLTSYATYNISIDACTVACSNRSEDHRVTTLMGQPGEVKKPFIEHINSSVFIFTWNAPDEPRGKIDYYQLRFMQKLGSVNDTDFPIINVTNTRHHSLSCASKSNTRSYVSVRAVNIMNNEHLPGPWSSPLETYCSQSFSLLYILAIIILIFVVVLLFMGGKKSYEIILNLKIIPKLPPGLQHDVDHSLVMSEKKPDDKDRNTKADRVSLLDPLSGNESGISSGHESITSSVESTGTLISGSDSGSEQPLSLTEDTRKNSLRQRNVSSKGYIAMPDPLVSSAASKGGVKTSPTSGNYCMLGVAPAVQPEPGSQYVPISETSTNIPFSTDLPTTSPHYAVTGELIKTPNPGYIPFNTAEPAPKNTGYVVAGEIGKTTTGYIPFSAAETTSKNTGYVVAGVPKDLLASLKED